MPTSVLPYVLTVNRFKLDVFLGVTDFERVKPQPIYLDIHIYYDEMPDSMKQDGVAYDCYDVITSRLIVYCSTRQFQTIEFLAGRLFDELRHEVTSAASLWLRVHKTNAHMSPDFTGGTSFIVSDLTPGTYPVSVAHG